MSINKNAAIDSFLDISVNMGNTQINFILQGGFFDAERDWAVSSHFHLCHEIHCVHEGSIELLVDDKAYILRKNDICIIPPHLNHYTKKVLQPTKKTSFLLNFSYQKTCENSKIAEHQVYNNIYSQINNVCIINNLDIINRYLENINTAFNTDKLFSVHKIKALFTLIFIEITENIIASRSTIGSYNVKTGLLKTYEEANQAENVRMVKIDGYINRNYMKDVTLSDLAGYLYLSEKQTDRILKKLTGLSFGKLLQKRRMEAARELILNSDLPINEIATQIGYSSYNGFYSAFKNVFGVSPQDLRDVGFLELP